MVTHHGTYESQLSIIKNRERIFAEGKKTPLFTSITNILSLYLNENTMMSCKLKIRIEWCNMSKNIFVGDCLLDDGILMQCTIFC